VSGMPTMSNNRATVTLVIGDLLAYVFSLILTLTIRYGAIPHRELLFTHLSAFWILFAISLIVNFSAGLYDKQTILIRGGGWGMLSRVQVANALISIVFFYFAPVSIAPKANLFIYFIISTAVLFVWRLIMFPVVTVTKKQNAIIIGEGDDMDDLYDEVNDSARYGLIFNEKVAPQANASETVRAISETLKRTKSTVLVADFHNPTIESAMPFLYSLVFNGVQIFDASKMYASIFDRIPLSMVGDSWLVENSSSVLGAHRLYDSVKRSMDIWIGGILGIISLVFYPFVYVAIKIEDKGPIFVMQERVGRDGKTVKFYKFRSMSGNDQGVYGSGGTTSHKVTRVGRFIRTTRIDELPQLWSIVKGDLSLIGPRPEFPALVQVYEKEIPYYNVRHLVKPGLSGWAQIYHQAHPHHAVATEETRDKLSYDLYYIKNRSLTLDIKIALRTIQILMKRVGK